MRQSLIAAVVVFVAACGGGSCSGNQGPPSAMSVAQNSSDFSGVKLCAESGTYDNYLKTEQAKAPTRYPTDNKTWDNLKAAGANDAYVAEYADSTSNCGQFGSLTTGKNAEVFAIRFKDSTSAAASYKNRGSLVNFNDSQIATLKNAGATVNQGSATGLGANSIVVAFSIPGGILYVALWQNKEFELALVIVNLPNIDGKAVATKINGRVR